MNELPLNFIFECFDVLPNGILQWKTRPLHHFKDDSDQRRWNTRYTGTEAGSPNSDGHLKVQLTFVGKTQFVFAHRIVWALTESAWPTQQLDHKNRIKSDNRRLNLRLATPTQNNQNRTMQKNNTSGFKGVSKNGDRWMASIRVEGKKINLGRYSTPEEASEVYRLAAEKYHGLFACT